MKVKIELTVGQAIAIFEEMLGSRSTNYILLARSLDKQIEPQLEGTEFYKRWKMVRTLQKSGSLELPKVYKDIIEGRL